MRAAAPLAALAALALAALAPRRALAQKLDAPLTTTPAMPATGLELSSRHPNFWQESRPRTFLAARVDLGYVYFRPLVAFGYGQPYWRWAGLETSPVVSGAGLAEYGGLRLALPRFEVRGGARYFLPFRRSFLDPQRSFTQLDAEERIGPKSRYASLEAEATTNLRAGLGDVILLGTVHYLLGVNPGYYVFDETMRVVADPPLIWRARVGYAIPLTSDRLFRLAPVAEVIGIPGRDAYIGRGGFVASATFSDFIDVIATFVPVIFSPDRLGLTGADFAQIGIRFRWASGTGGPTAGPGETLPEPPKRPAASAPARPGAASSLPASTRAPAATAASAVLSPPGSPPPSAPEPRERDTALRTGP